MVRQCVWFGLLLCWLLRALPFVAGVLEQDKKPVDKMGRIQRDQYSLNPIQLDVMLGVSSEAKVGIGSHRVG